MGKYDLNSLLGELKKTEDKTGGNDRSSDFWKPTLEKGEERAEYVIRFLPNPDSEGSSPWLERHAHMFNFPNGKFLYEPCPKKSKKGDCFICNEVSELYKSGDPTKEAIGSKRFAKQRIFYNVLIVKDPRDNGVNEGKVMIYEAGKQIHTKCIEFIKNADLEPKERLFFHPVFGTNFKVVMTWQSDYPNYDKSDFMRKPSPIEVKGKELNEEQGEKFVEEKTFKLNEKLMGEKAFKSNEELKALYLNQGTLPDKKKEVKKSSSVGEEVEADVSDMDDNDVTIKNKPIQTRNPAKQERVKAEPVKAQVEDDEEDDDAVPFDQEDETDEDDEEALAKLLED